MSASRELVLLHGFTGSAAVWDDALREGLERRAEVIVRAVTLPGHEGLGRWRRDGRSSDAVNGEPRAPVTLDDAFRTVSEAARWPATLCGYSMGGRLALQYAAAFPERVERLVLESASPGLASEDERAARRRADEDRARRLELRGIGPFVRDWEALPLFATQARLDAGTLARQRTQRLAHDPHALAAALRGFGPGVLPTLWDRLENLHVPTLLIVGEHDHRYVEIAAEMAEKMPNARVHVVRGAGHNVHLEEPDAWLRAVADFMQKSTP